MKSAPCKQNRNTVIGTKVSANSRQVYHMLSMVKSELWMDLKMNEVHPTIMSSFSRMTSMLAKADSEVNSCR